MPMQSHKRRKLLVLHGRSCRGSRTCLRQQAPTTVGCTAYIHMLIQQRQQRLYMQQCQSQLSTDSASELGFLFLLYEVRSAKN